MVALHVTAELSTVGGDACTPGCEVSCVAGWGPSFGLDGRCATNPPKTGREPILLLVLKTQDRRPCRCSDMKQRDRRAMLTLCSLQVR